jgi:rhodanese-related sulfurtransferase
MNSGTYLKQVKAQIRETDVEAVRKTVEARQGKAGDGNGAGPILIDVREKDEWTEGFIPGARWISRGFLESRIEESGAGACVGDRSLLRGRNANRRTPPRRFPSSLHQRQVDGGRFLGVEARRPEVRSAVRDDAGAEPALRAPHDVARGG